MILRKIKLKYCELLFGWIAAVDLFILAPLLNCKIISFGEDKA